MDHAVRSRACLGVGSSPETRCAPFSGNMALWPSGRRAAIESCRSAPLPERSPSRCLCIVNSGQAPSLRSSARANSTDRCLKSEVTQPVCGAPAPSAEFAVVSVQCWLEASPRVSWVPRHEHSYFNPVGAIGRIYPCLSALIWTLRSTLRVAYLADSVVAKIPKRNEARFPEDFRFQLNKEELESLTSQSAIAKPPSGRGGRLCNHRLRIHEG